MYFSDYFPVISGFSIDVHIQIHHHFSSFFFRVLASGPLLTKFSTLTQSSSYATDYSYVK